MIKSLTAAIVTCLFVSHAAAGVIYTNLTTSQTYNAGGGLTIDPTHDVAQAFVAGTSGNLSTIQVAVKANPNLVTSTLFHMVLVNNNSGAPGSVIEDLGTVGVSASSFNDNSYLAVGTSSTHPLLTAGTTYWVEALGLPANSPFPGTQAYWASNATGDSTHPNTRFNGGAWSWPGTSAMALQVNSAPVPEPSAYLLLLSGILTMGTIAWRRSKSR
jgi:virulence family protein